MSDGTTTVTREKVKPGIWRRRNSKGAWVYEITFRDSNGTQRRQTVPGGMREAQTALASVQSRMGRGERVTPAPRLTFADAAEAWYDAKSPALAEKTLAAYRYALDVHLLPQFGRQRMDRIDVTAVSRFVGRMLKPEYRQAVERREGAQARATDGYAVETIKLVLTPLSRTFAYAKRHMGFAGENAVAALDLDERPGYRKRRTEPATLTRAELDRLIEHASTPWREIIATAAALGTRAGETLGIPWSAVNFDTGNVTIMQQATERRELAQVKTIDSTRTIEAPAWLMAMFAEIKLRSESTSPDDLVFCTRTGKPHGRGNLLSRGLYPAMERAGLQRKTFHAMRHTHASLWIKDGGDVVTLSKRLGHSSPQVTVTTYMHAIEEANDDAVRRSRVDAMYANSKMAALMGAPHQPSQNQDNLHELDDRRRQAMTS